MPAWAQVRCGNYVAVVVGPFIKELGPVVTALMVAGRGIRISARSAR